MNQNQFVDWLVETALGFSRRLTDFFWNSVSGGGGAVAWFTANWLRFALALVIAGLIVDWLVWMVRWRPYWIWFHKRQIIYADESHRPVKRPAPAPAPVDPPRRRMPVPRGGYEDPFAEGAEDPFDFRDGDGIPEYGAGRGGRTALGDTYVPESSRERYARPVGRAAAKREEDLWEGYEEEENAPEPEPDEVWVEYASEDDESDGPPSRFSDDGKEFEGAWDDQPSRTDPGEAAAEASNAGGRGGGWDFLRGERSGDRPRRSGQSEGADAERRPNAPERGPSARRRREVLARDGEDESQNDSPPEPRTRREGFRWDAEAGERKPFGRPDDPDEPSGRVSDRRADSRLETDMPLNPPPRGRRRATVREESGDETDSENVRERSDDSLFWDDIERPSELESPDKSERKPEVPALLRRSPDSDHPSDPSATERRGVRTSPASRRQRRAAIRGEDFDADPEESDESVYQASRRQRRATVREEGGDGLDGESVRERSDDSLFWDDIERPSELESPDKSERKPEVPALLRRSPDSDRPSDSPATERRGAPAKRAPRERKPRKSQDGWFGS